MKNIPKVITNLERAIAFMEGIHAFDGGSRREHNPYIGRNDDLMQAWWHGWDQAQEEKDAWKNTRGKNDCKGSEL